MAFLLGLSLALSLFGRGSLATIVYDPLGGVDSSNGRLDLFGYALLSRFPFALFLVLLIGRLCDLDNDDAAVELFLVQELCGLLRGLEGVEGDEAIACRAVAAVDDLSGKTADAVSTGKWQR